MAPADQSFEHVESKLPCGTTHLFYGEVKESYDLALRTANLAFYSLVCFRRARSGILHRHGSIILAFAEAVQLSWSSPTQERRFGGEIRAA